MTDFVVTITDPEQLAGISWAREQYNANLPMPAPPLNPDDPPSEPVPPIDSDEDYVQWVMGEAAASYAQQKIDADWRAAYETQMAARKPGAAPARKGEPAPKDDADA